MHSFAQILANLTTYIELFAEELRTKNGIDSLRLSCLFSLLDSCDSPSSIHLHAFPRGRGARKLLFLAGKLAAGLGPRSAG